MLVVVFEAIIGGAQLITTQTVTQVARHLYVVDERFGLADNQLTVMKLHLQTGSIRSRGEKKQMPDFVKSNIIQYAPKY